MLSRLDDVSIVLSGYAFRGKIIENKSGSVIAVQMRNVDLDGNRVDWTSAIRTLLPGRPPATWLLNNDVIFTARGTNNHAVIVKDCPEKAVLSPHFFQIRVNSDIILPEFLAWQINQKPAQKYFKKSAEGSAIVGIRKSILDDLPIVTPPLDEQQKIVETIHCWNKQYDILNALQKSHLDMMDAIASNIVQGNK